MPRSQTKIKPPKNGVYYTTDEVAELFGVHINSVKLWLTGKMGHKMNGIKISNRWQISQSEVIRYANLLYGSGEGMDLHD